MSISSFCIGQRQKEQQKLKKLLATGFVGSLLVHSGIAFALSNVKPQPLEKVEKPIELVIVETPKPKPKPKPQAKIEAPKPEPEPPRQVKIEPPKPEPQVIKPQPIQPPKPEPQVIKPNPSPAPPKPAPIATAPTKLSTPTKPVAPPTPLTSATGEPNLYNPVGGDVGGSSKLRAGFSSGSTDPSANGDAPQESEVATNSVPPSVPKEATGGISCINNCEPEYPATLAGAEGNAVIGLTVDPGGNVTSASIVTANSDSNINRQALLAARQMKFSSPGNNSASVRVKIDFTVAGSEYDRLAREQQRERELAEQKRQEQETAARQQQLERERQALQEQQQRQQAEAEQKRQAELQQQQQQSIPNTQTTPKPLSTPSATEADEEMLRKFRERIEQHQQ